MFCEKCGAKLEDDAKFCFNCGAKITAEIPNQEMVVHTEKKRRISPVKICIIAAIGVCIIGILVFVLTKVSHKLSDQREQQKTEDAIENVVDSVADAEDVTLPQPAEEMEQEENTNAEQEVENTNEWQEIYLAGMDDGKIISDDYLQYDLKNLNADDIPELITSVDTGEFCIYTVDNGHVKEVMYGIGSIGVKGDLILFDGRLEMEICRMSPSFEHDTLFVSDCDNAYHLYDYEGDTISYDEIKSIAEQAIGCTFDSFEYLQYPYDYNSIRTAVASYDSTEEASNSSVAEEYEQNFESKYDWKKVYLNQLDMSQVWYPSLVDLNEDGVAEIVANTDENGQYMSWCIYYIDKTKTIQQIYITYSSFTYGAGKIYSAGGHTGEYWNSVYSYNTSTGIYDLIFDGWGEDHFDEEGNYSVRYQIDEKNVSEKKYKQKLDDITADITNEYDGSENSSEDVNIIDLIKNY